MNPKMESIRTAIVVGSTRPYRQGPAIAEWVAAAPAPGLALEIVDLAELDLPLLEEPAPAITQRYEQSSTRRFSRLIAGFDAFVLVTPEYNHSTSGALKNALDHLYAEWRDKPVAFVGYGIDGGTRAVEHLRTICAELGMAGVGAQVAIRLGDDLTEDGACEPRESQLGARTRMLETLERWAGALRSLRAPDAPGGRNERRERPTLDRPDLHPSAKSAIERFVEGIQVGLDEADAERYDADFAADVLWGSPYGATLSGIEPLLTAHRRLTAAGVAAASRYEVVRTLAPAPGIALAQVRRRALDETEAGFSEMALYVLVERGGRWWLAAGQNTPITPKRSG